MAKYQQYYNFKESFLVWMGNVPEHWDINKFKWIFQEKTKTLNPSLPAGSISFGNVIYKNEKNLSPDTKASYQEVLNGEYLINPLNLNFDLKSLRTALSQIDVVVSTGYIVLIDNGKFNKQYLRWLLYEFDVAHMKKLGSGVRQTINYTDIANSLFFHPEFNEQTQIANFLDHETAQIDTLIDKQQTLIQLLKEKRQAVISHAVTKGLNPDAPMKDSGVEWLGEVPEHWVVKGIKRLSEIKRGASPRPIADPKYFDDEGEYAWTRIADVSRAGMYLDTTTQRLSDLGASLSVKLEAGELFLSIAGTVGKPCITISKACIHDGFVYFPTLKINNKFLFYIFEAGQAYLGLGKMGTQLNLNTETVGGIEIGLPPKEEIEAIIKYIEVEKIRFNNLINKAEQAIQLMQERRTALISAAVTGKIDVRGWRASE